MSLCKSSNISQQNLTTPNLCGSYIYAFEDFRLDAEHLMLYRCEQTIPLKPKVVETLVALVERRGEVVGKSELMDRLWADSFVEESNLTQNIYLLRKTLGNTIDGRPFIETFSRRGYRFNGESWDQTGTAELLVATRTRTRTIIEEATGHGRRRTRNFLVAGTIAACVLLVLSVSAFLLFRNKNNEVPGAFANFKLKRYSDRGDITTAAVSRDGKLIAYSDKKKAVWLKNTATGSDVKILPESENYGSSVVAISPDNNYVYISRTFPQKKNELLKMSIFGGPFQQTIARDSWSDPAISPDGERISFIRGDGEGHRTLIFANTDGSGEREVAASRDGERFGMWGQSTAWSPDGGRIACTGESSSNGKETWNIKILIAADGREISRIQPDLNWRWIDAVAWLPDGDNLLVIGAGQSSLGQIYRYTISTGEWRGVTNDLNNYLKLFVTADGKNVVTVQDENECNLWLLPAGSDWGQARQITFGRNLLTDVTGLSWTPDGKILYATNASGRWEIWMIDADGGNQRQLTQNCAGNDSCRQPAASPDGRYIVFQATRGGVDNIWRMDSDGSNPTQLTQDSGVSPTISPDGHFVIYSDQTPSSTLRQVRIEGGDPVRLNGISTALAASISPDGKSLIFGYFDKAANMPRTCVAPVEADAPEKCFGMSRSFPRWAGNKAFYYLDPQYTGIWRQPLDGGRELVLEYPGERLNNFAFSPDGRQLVVARSKQTIEIVALIDGQ